MALANLSIYYTWKNIMSEYSNLEFYPQLGMILWTYLMVLVQFQTFKITLNLSSKITKLTIQIYVNGIKNRIVFKIKTRYKLELLTPETMKLLESTKKKCQQRWRQKKCAKIIICGSCFSSLQSSQKWLSTHIKSFAHFCSK